jgi:MerR family transcriptional regulator, copper efflux regulator
MNRLDEYVKVAEAARILGVSQNTIRSWAEKGKIPSTRNPVNGYRLFLRDDLEAFLAEIKNNLKSSSQ